MIILSNGVIYFQCVYLGIGSFRRIAKHLKRDPEFFLKHGVTQDDAEELARAMVAKGLLDEIPKVFIPNSAANDSLVLTKENLEASLVDVSISSSKSCKRMSILHPQRKPRERKQEDIDAADADKKEVVGLIETLTSVFDGDNEDRVLFFLTALVKITTGSRRKQKYFGRNGACPLIIKIIRKFSKSHGVVEAAMDAISVLCRNQEDKRTENLENIKKFGEEKACEVLTKLLETFKDDEEFGSDFTKRVCDCVRYLCALRENKILFGELGMCSMLTQELMKYFQHSALTSQFICRAVGHLASQCPENVELFGAEGTCEGVVATLNRQAGNRDVCIECFWAIRNLGNRDRFLNAKAEDTLFSVLTTGANDVLVVGETCRALASFISGPDDPLCDVYFDAGVPSAVRKALIKFSDSEFLSQWAFQLLCALASNENAIRQLVAYNVLELIQVALQQHGGNEGVAEWCMRLIHSMSHVRDTLTLMKTAGLCESVVTVLQRQSRSAVVCSWAGSAVGDLASERDNRNRLGECGAGEAVVFALRRHDCDADVATKICYAIHFLATDENNRSWMGSNLGCEAVTNALKLHFEDIDSAQMSLRAVGSLGYKDEGNLPRFVAAGALESVIKALNLHIYDPHAVEYGCRAIANLAWDPKNVKPLGINGACQVVVEALTKHSDNFDCVRQACLAIRALAVRRSKNGLHRHNTAVMVNAGVLDVLISSTDKHKEIPLVASAAASAIGGLAQEDLNRDKLGKLDACNLIMELFHIHGQFDFVVVECAAAVNSLATGHDVNKEAFVARNIADVLLKSMINHDDSADVAHSNLQSLVTLSSVPEVKLRLKSSNACRVYVNALQKHQNNPLVVEWFCRMIYNIADTEDKTREKLGLEGACESLVAAFIVHHSNEVIAEWGFKAIVSLAAFEPNCRRFDSSSCFECCANALKEGHENVIVAEWGCSAIICISRGDVGYGNAAKLGNAGICQSVALAIVKHSESKNVAMLASEAITNIAVIPANKSFFGNSGAVEALLSALSLHKADIDASRIFVKACGMLSYQHNKNTNRLIANGGCDIIPSAIFDHPHNVAIAQWGCNTIANIASMSDLAQNALDEANACQAIMGSMQRHRTHEWTVVHATRAVRSLSYKNSSIKLKFSQQDIFTLLLSALKTHSAVGSVVENACWGIGCIDLPPKCEIFKSNSAWEVIVSAARIHEMNPLIFKWACTAVAAACESEIVSYKDDLTAVEAPTGATGAVTNLPFMNPVVNRLMSPLPVIPLVTVKSSTFSETHCTPRPSACDMICAGLYRHLHAEEAVQRACVAVAALAKANGENQARLGRQNCCQMLSSLLEIYQMNDKIQIDCCVAISKVAKNRPDHQSLFSTTCNFILGTLHAHSNDAAVVKAGLEALISIVTNHASNKSRITPGCSFFSKSLNKYSNVEKVTQVLLMSINAIAHQHFSNRSKLGITGCCQSLGCIVDTYKENAHLSLLAVKAVANLSANHPNNCAKLGHAGVIEVIIECLKKFSLPSNLVESSTFVPHEVGMDYLKFALWALGNLVQPDPKVEIASVNAAAAAGQPPEGGSASDVPVSPTASAESLRALTSVISVASKLSSKLRSKRSWQTSSNNGRMGQAGIVKIIEFILSVDIFRSNAAVVQWTLRLGNKYLFL